MAYRNSWTLDARVGRWTLDTGFSTLCAGHWTMAAQRQNVDVKDLKFKTLQRSGNNGAISITSFLNSLIGYANPKNTIVRSVNRKFCYQALIKNGIA